MSTVNPFQNSRFARSSPKAVFSLMSLGFAGILALGGCGGGDTAEPEPWSAMIERAAAQAAAGPAVSSVEANAKGAAPVIAAPKRIDSVSVTSGAAVAQAASSSCYPPPQYETMYLYEVDVVNGSIPASGIKTLGSYNKPIFPAISVPIRGAGPYCGGGASYEDALQAYSNEMQIRSAQLTVSYDARIGLWHVAQDAINVLRLRLDYCDDLADGGIGGLHAQQCTDYPRGTSVQVFVGEGSSLQEMVSNGRYSMVMNVTI